MMKRRAMILNEIDALRADLQVVDRSILHLEAMDRAKKLGIKTTDKTLKKAQAWGTIVILIEREGPLTTAGIKERIAPYMDVGQPATLRSYLYRMDLEKIIYRGSDRRWRLTDLVISPVE
jgi:hypothetical protein